MLALTLTLTLTLTLALALALTRPPVGAAGRRADPSQGDQELRQAEVRDGVRASASGSGFGFGVRARARRPRAPPSEGARPPISRQAQRPLEHARHGSPPLSPATCALGPGRIVLGGAPHCLEGLAAMPPRAREQRPGHGRLSLAPHVADAEAFPTQVERRRDHLGLSAVVSEGYGGRVRRGEVASRASLVNPSIF